MNGLLRSFVNLIFPAKCLACDILLYNGEVHLCIGCLMTLPSAHVDIKQKKEGALKKFYGLVPWQDVYALYLFTKKGRVQRLLHNLKYYEGREALYLLGRYMGLEIARRGWGVDMIVPVPLHPRRRQERGYNQSALLAKGMGEMLKCPYDEGLLERYIYTSSQTRKNREERFYNVKEAFKIVKGAYEKVQGKNILVVDDVITTGATLAAAGEQLLAGEAKSLFVASLALGI